MKKLIRTTLLALIFCFALLPTTAGAADPTTVTDESGLTSAIAGTSEIIKLGGDIEISSTLQVNREVTLDLNGYVLSRTGDGSVIKVGDASTPATTGNLTLIDSAPNNGGDSHKFITTAAPWTQNTSGTEIKGGVITGGNASATDNSYGGGVWVSNGTFTMQGGNIVGCKADVGGGGVAVKEANGTGSGAGSRNFTMQGGSIVGCAATGETDSGGGVYVGGSSTFKMSGTAAIKNCTAKQGGGVVVYSTAANAFTMSGNAIIQSCTAVSNGGGVFIASTGKFAMSGGTIDGCTAFTGGGVYVNNTTDTGAFTMSNGTIKNCTTTSNGKGGGVFVNGKFAMSGGTIQACTTGSSGNGKGGGVYVSGTNNSVFTMSGGTIESCTAGGSGGGVYVDSSSSDYGTFTMTGGTIKSCEAYVEGGGVYITGSATFTMSGGTIESCTAPYSNASGGGVYVNYNATFKMETNSGVTPATTGTIKNCTAARYGGGVFVYGSSSSSNRGTFTMSGGTIKNCTTSGNGGGVCNIGTFTMSGGTIDGNDTPDATPITNAKQGGGVYSLGNFTMSGGTIKNCTTSGNGGGVCQDTRGSFTMSGADTKITNCKTTSGNGGGVFVGTGTGTGTGTAFTMEAGTIESCTATGSGGGVYTNGTSKLQGGTIQNNTATTSGGGVFVCAGKTLTVGGDSSPATVKIMSNTKGTDTPDNVYLDKEGDNTGKIATASDGLTDASDIRVTRWDDTNAQNLRYIGGLDLSSSDFNTDQSSVDATNQDGYTWTAATKTLTLQNAYVGTRGSYSLKLPDGSVDTVNIEISEKVLFDFVDFAYSTGAGPKNTNIYKKTDAESANLNVPGTFAVGVHNLTLTNITANINQINNHGGTGSLTLDGAKVTTTNISWYFESSYPTNGVFLKNSSELTVSGDGTSYNFWAGYINIDDLTSWIQLVNSGAGSYNANMNSSYSQYLPSGYHIDIASDPTRAILDSSNNSLPLNITLQRTAASTPPAPSGPTYYRVTVSEPVNGTVEASATRATRGTTITVTTAAASGYGLETLTVLDRNNREVALTDLGGGKYTFRMPSSSVTVSAYFTLLPNFDDVDPDDYFYDPVRWAVNNGITDGIGGGKFGPDLTCTRAQIVTFLWRTSGQPIAERTEMPFTDVAPNSFYYDAVLWAIETGITLGTSDTTFSPDLTCSREQAVTFLYRYAVYNGIDTSVGEDTNILSYTDAFEVSDFAVPAMQWAVGSGVVQGAGGKLMPLSDCTRGQIITMLYRTMNP